MGGVDNSPPDYSDALIDLAKNVAAVAEAFTMIAWAVEGLERRIAALEEDNGEG